MVMRRSKHDIAGNLIQKLWKVFVDRVSYARHYEKAVSRRSGSVVIDHIGFRTLRAHTGEQPEGMWAFRHIFDCLGYTPSEEYNFPKKKIKAMHLEPGEPGLPMVFISELEVSQLPEWAQHEIAEAVGNTPYLISDTGIELLNRLKTDGELTEEASEVLENELMRYFHRPWNPPYKETVLKINELSHYGAWVLLHGNAPSHFACLVSQQNVAGWIDIATTCKALQNEGIPMKKEIEGENGSSLQQSATMAVKEEVTVRDNGRYEDISWTYGYLELVQRAQPEDNGGSPVPKFIESQERHLYQMTITLEN
jgi:hypothetical protein